LEWICVGETGKFRVYCNKGQCHSCILRYYVVAIEKQLIDIASLVKEMLGKGTSVIDSAHYSNKAILCPRSNDVGNISEEVLNSL
jgi:hypothetical protein